MYNEGFKTPVLENLNKSETPVLIELIEFFEKELGNYSELSIKIKSRLQNIYKLDEPKTPEGAD